MLILQSLRYLVHDPHWVCYFSVIVCSAFATAWLYSGFSRRPLSRVPGPWYSALTNVVLLWHEFCGTRRLYVHALHSHYGSVLRLGPKEVSFTSPDAITTIYGLKGFSKPKLFDLFTQRGTRNIFTFRHKHEHSQAKRRFAAQYSNSNILAANNLNKIRERSQAFIRSCLLSSNSGSEVDIYRLLHAFALDCVTHVLFAPHGTDSLADPQRCDMIQVLSYHDSRKSLTLKHNAPLLHKIWKLAGYAKGKDSARIEELVCENVKTTTKLADFAISTKLKTYSDMSENEIYAECADHLFAGVETTGDTLCFLIWHLSQPSQRDFQRRLQSELREAVAGGAADARIHQLPYLNAVVDEGLRLFTAAASYLPREAPELGITIDGYTIPPGCIVSCQPYTVHRSEVTFPEAESFLPERWLAPNPTYGTTADDFSNRLSHRYVAADQHIEFLAFGSGPRSCIGKHLARAEMRQLLFAVYSQYSTSPDPMMQAKGYCMQMGDQLLTVRPRDMICLVKFHAIQG